MKVSWPYMVHVLNNYKGYQPFVLLSVYSHSASIPHLDIDDA